MSKTEKYQSLDLQEPMGTKQNLKIFLIKKIGHVIVIFQNIRKKRLIKYYRGGKCYKLRAGNQN